MTDLDLYIARGHRERAKALQTGARALGRRLRRTAAALRQGYAVDSRRHRPAH